MAALGRLPLALVLASTVAGAVEATPQEAAREQLERLRAEVARDLHLAATDLLDELVYRWTLSPPFSAPTPTVVADVTVPVGLGSGLSTMLENHLATLLLGNSRANVRLAHCPACRDWVVHSGARGTVIARGVDSPETLPEAARGSGARHALFLDFEAEGESLVLRAHIVELAPALPVVHALSLSSSTSAAPLLRAPAPLVSAAEARKEYLDLLQGRGSVSFPIRMGVRTYASTQQLSALPFVWLQFGAELGLGQARPWTGSIMVGLSWAPELHTAWLGQARISRLLTGSAASLTHPDVYLFLGGAVISVYGQSALGFATDAVTIAQLAQLLALNRTPSTTFGVWQLGVEARIKNRVGVGFFLEGAPALTDATFVGRFIDLGPLSINTWGAEVSFCF